MRKKLFEKSFKILCVAIVALAMSVCFFACTPDEANIVKTAETPVYNTTGNPQKAIIILPGVMGSNLVSLETEKPLWSVGSLISNVAMNENMLDSEGRFNMSEFDGYLSSFLKHGLDGSVQIPVRAANMNDADLQYGFYSYYKTLYEFMNVNYGPESAYGYQVKVFQYDWTKSCTDCAADLGDFIAANKYTDVILLGHSMGGLVIDYYLAASEQNRNNTDAVVTFSTPHLGAVDAASLLFAGAMPSMASVMLSSAEFSTMLGELEGKLPAGCNSIVDFAMMISDSLKNIARTIPCTYEMLPNTSLFETEQFESISPYYIGGTACSYHTMNTTLKDMPWVRNNAYISSVVNGLAEKQASLYIGGVFVSNLVQSYYFAGRGVNTTLSDYLTVSDEDFSASNFDFSAEGDLLVLVDSSLAGNGRTAENAYIFDDTDHMEITAATDSVTGKNTAVGNKLLEVMAKILGE